MTRTLVLVLCVTLAACASVPPRTQTTGEARAMCATAAHSPLVALGIDPEGTVIVARGWTYNGRTRLGEFNTRTRLVTVVNHPEVMAHESIHRALWLLGERMAAFSALFRDDEHALIFYVLDRDFPGLQNHRIPVQRRIRAKDRWTSPDYAERLKDLEARARSTPGWCATGQRPEPPQ